MNIQALANFFFRYPTLGTGVILLVSDNFTSRNPSSTVRRPAALPGRIIFSNPVRGFPSSKAFSIAIKAILFSFLSRSKFFFWNRPFFSTKRTSDGMYASPVGPAKQKAVFSPTRIGTEVPFKYSIWFQLKCFITERTMGNDTVFLTSRIDPGKISASTNRTTKPSMLGWFFGKIIFHHKLLIALDTVHFYS
jgi:hypothetical protein